MKHIAQDLQQLNTTIAQATAERTSLYDAVRSLHATTGDARRDAIIIAAGFEDPALDTQLRLIEDHLSIFRDTPIGIVTWTYSPRANGFLSLACGVISDDELHFEPNRLRFQTASAHLLATPHAVQILETDLALPLDALRNLRMDARAADPVATSCSMLFGFDALTQFIESTDFVPELRSRIKTYLGRLSKGAIRSSIRPPGP